MAGCDHMREDCKVRFDTIDKRFESSDNKFEKLSTDIQKIDLGVTKILIYQENNKDKIDSQEKEIKTLKDNSGFTLKDILKIGISFALGLISAILLFFLKGGGTP